MVYTGNEVITFQFGHYSNFIGTHWWNCQEAGFEYIPDTPSEINHDVLFREGQTHRGEVTYTPRLLLVDFKGSLGTLPETGKLYDVPPIPDPSILFWPTDKVCIQSKEREHKNEFLLDLEQAEKSSAALPIGLKEKGHAVPKLYHLDDPVKSWSDFLRPHLHPRSINLVQEYQYKDTSFPFDTFPQGHTLWGKPRFNEEFTDRIRLYMEETDNLQGFQVVLDSFDGFSGLGCAGLQYLKEEYSTKSAICFACQPPQMYESTRKQDSVRIVNQALTMSSLAEHANLFIPISGSTKAWRSLGSPAHLPYLNYKPELYYHTSAIIASALDSLSLIYRLRSSSEGLSDLTARHAFYNRFAAALSVGLPFTMRPDATLLDTLDVWEGPITYSLTPHVDIHTGQCLQTYVLRGVPESRLMKPDQANMSSSNPAYTCRTLAQLLKTYLLFDTQTTVPTNVISTGCALNTSAPFPHIFHQNISTDGHCDSQSRSQQYGVNQVPVLAGLHTTKSLGPLLESLHSEAKQINIRSLHQFSNSGLESTELLESLEQLLCLSECYSDSQMDF